MNPQDQPQDINLQEQGIDPIEDNSLPAEQIIAEQTSQDTGQNANTPRFIP